MSKKQLIVACAIALFLLTGCATIYNPATGRQDKIFAFITPQVEAICGAYFLAQVPAIYRTNIYQDARVSTIGRKVAAVSDRRRDFNYSFIVLNDPNPNAFTASGGYVYVTKGLLDMASSEDEIASVIAHELGHDACRHTAKALIANYAFPILMKALSKEKKDTQLIVNAVYAIIKSGYSRQDEREADKLAIRYTKNSGYNPEAFITFFQKLQNLERMYGASGNSLTATHPPISERIRNARAEIASFTSNSSYTYSNNVTQDAYSYVKSKGLRASNENVAAGLYSSVGSQGSNQANKENWNKLQNGLDVRRVIFFLGEPLSREYVGKSVNYKYSYPNGGYVILKPDLANRSYCVDYWKEPK